MKRILFTVIAMAGFGPITVLAQESLNGTGGDALGSGGSASYSVGQVAFTYKTGIPGSSNDGVQQPFEFFVVGIKEDVDISIQMSVFPNPADATISLEIKTLLTQNHFYQLFDTEGRLLADYEINNVLTLIPMHELAQGTYLLKIYTGKKTLKTFAIIKNQ